MGNSIPITSKTSAVAPAKKMNKDIVNASKGNKYDHTTATLRAVAGAPPISTLMPGGETPAMYSPAKDHSGTDDFATPKGTDNHTHAKKDSKTKVFNTEGVGGTLNSSTTTIPGQKPTSIVKPGEPGYDKWLAAVTADPSIEDKFKDKTTNTNTFTPDTVTKKISTPPVPGEPQSFVSDKWSMNQNIKAINKYDKNQAKQVKKLNKKRDGKGFLGFQRKSELRPDEVVRTKKDGTKIYGTGDADYLNLLDKQKKQRIDETRPEGSGTDIYKYGLNNRGLGGKSSGGTPSVEGTQGPDVEEVRMFNTDTDKQQPEVWDANQNKMVPNPEYQTRLSDSMGATAANPVPAAVYHPEKIKIGNSKSFKMKSMKFKG